MQLPVSQSASFVHVSGTLLFCPGHAIVSANQTHGTPSKTRINRLITKTVSWSISSGHFLIRPPVAVGTSVDRRAPRGPRRFSLINSGCDRAPTFKAVINDSPIERLFHLCLFDPSAASRNP